jgi:hypothetical protein
MIDAISLRLSEIREAAASLRGISASTVAGAGSDLVARIRRSEVG